MELTSEQAQFLMEPNLRWNIKQGTIRLGKTYLDYFVIPKQIKERKSIVGNVLLLGNTQFCSSKNSYGNKTGASNI